MHFSVISAVPKLLESPLSHSILKRAVDKGLMSYDLIDLHTYGVGKHRQIDDYQYGGGSGMVMMCEPVAACIDELSLSRDYDEVIFMTPDGVKYDQAIANELSLKKNLIIVAGHYKGLDERLREKYVTREISIGDFVLSGGELPAAILIDSIGRLLPGVLNDETSALSDSFQDGLLAPPVYTRPAEWRGEKVPDVLLSGHDAKITEWRHLQSEKRTEERRPDLLED